MSISPLSLAFYGALLIGHVVLADLAFRHGSNRLGASILVVFALFLAYLASVAFG